MLFLQYLLAEIELSSEPIAVATTPTESNLRGTHRLCLDSGVFSPDGQTLASGSWDRNDSVVGYPHASATQNDSL